MRFKKNLRCEYRSHVSSAAHSYGTFFFLIRRMFFALVLRNRFWNFEKGCDQDIPIKIPTFVAVILQEFRSNLIRDWWKHTFKNILSEKLNCEFKTSRALQVENKDFSWSYQIGLFWLSNEIGLEKQIKKWRSADQILKVRWKMYTMTIFQFFSRVFSSCYLNGHPAALQSTIKIRQRNYNP